MGKRTGSYTISNFICPSCGKSFPIPRRSGQQRKNKHKKTLWCPYCSKVVDMREKKSSTLRQT